MRNKRRHKQRPLSRELKSHVALRKREAKFNAERAQRRDQIRDARRGHLVIVLALIALGLGLFVLWLDILIEQGV